MLVELLAIGRGEDDLVVLALGFQCGYAPVNRLALYHHAGEASVGIVVDPAPFVEGVVAEVVQVYLCQPFLLGPCQNGLVDEALKHLWQYCYDVYSHFLVWFCGLLFCLSRSGSEACYEVILRDDAYAQFCRFLVFA